MKLDVLVVGGGPGGSACAAVLAEGGARVGLVAPSGGRSETGELLHASTTRSLAALGIGERALASVGRECLGVASAWGRHREPYGAAIPARSGLCLDRSRFDELLRDNAASRGAVLLQQAAPGGRPEWNDGWRFSAAEGARSVEARADFVVEATGRTRSSAFAPSRARIYEDALVALAVRAAPDPTTTYVALVESVAGGWWYSVMLCDGELLLAFFTDSDLLPRDRSERARLLGEQLAQSTWTRRRIASGPRAVEFDRAAGHDARMSARRQPISTGWLAIGDALMALDPLSGHGIGEAVRSGVAAANALLAGSERPQRVGLEMAVRYTMHRYNEHRARRLKIYGRETAWRDSPFWRRRHAAARSAMQAGDRQRSQRTQRRSKHAY